jgi:hypothetical protein
MKDPAWIDGDPVARGLVPDPPDNWIDPDEKKALLELKEAYDPDTIRSARLFGEIPETARVLDAQAAANAVLKELDEAIDAALDDTVSEFDCGDWV